MTPEQLLLIGMNSKSFPQYVFKYRPVNDFTKKIITQNELWFSNPLVFNDPYDCNSPIDSKTPLTNIKKWLEDVGVALGDIDNFANILLKNPNYMQEATEQEISKLRICCFSTMDNSILQWSHYSDYHKGICLKFDITEDPNFFLIPVIVAYRKTLQHYNHFTQSKNIVDYLIKPKFSEWSYESEIRVVKQKSNIEYGGESFKFNDNALKEVIFGIKTPNKQIEEYKQLCMDNNMTHVHFFKMELGQGTHYEITKHPI